MCESAVVISTLITITLAAATATATATTMSIGNHLSYVTYVYMYCCAL
jgi:hypothetical protein